MVCLEHCLHSIETTNKSTQDVMTGFGGAQLVL